MGAFSGYKSSWGKGYLSGRGKQPGNETRSNLSQQDLETEKEYPEEGRAKIEDHLTERHAETGHAHSHIEHHGDGRHTSHHIDEEGRLSGPVEHESTEDLKSHLDQFDGDGPDDNGIDDEDE